MSIAAGLVIIMIGATVLTLAAGPIAALMPAVVGILAGLIAYGRWRLAPHRGPSRWPFRRAAQRAALRPAG